MRKSAGLLIVGVTAGLIGVGYFFANNSSLLRAKSIVWEFEREQGAVRLEVLSEELDELYVKHPSQVRGIYFSALENALNDSGDGFSMLFECFRKPVRSGDRGRLYDVLDFFSRVGGVEQNDYLKMRAFEKCVQEVSGIVLRRPWLFLPETSSESVLLYDFAIRGEQQNFWINSNVLDSYAYILAARNVGSADLKSRYVEKIRCESLFQYNRVVYDLCGARIVKTVEIDVSDVYSLDEVLFRMESARRECEFGNDFVK